MKYVPLLDEQRFQSMVAVPILSRANETIGVIVLHTEAPHEFPDDTLKLLVHIASLVSGAVENAQLYDQQRRRVDSLTGLSGLAQRSRRRPTRPSSAARSPRARGGCSAPAVCQLHRLDGDGAALEMLASSPGRGGAAADAVGRRRAARRRSTGTARGRAARTLWPELEVADLLVTPLSAGGERVGLLCAGSPRWAHVQRRGRRDRARDRAPGRRRDQARGADRRADEREHRQGSVRGAGRRRDRVRRGEGGGGALRADRAVSGGVRRAGGRGRAGLGRVAGRR